MNIKTLPLAVVLLLLLCVSGAAQCLPCAPADISGKVVDGSRPVAGAVMTLTGGPAPRIVTTDAAGRYLFAAVPINTLYVITAQAANYRFAPAERAFVPLSNMSEQDFLAAPSGPPASPLLIAEFFVRQQYVDLLLREPDEGGLNFWAGIIKVCELDKACARQKRRDVMCAFVQSAEYQSRFPGPAITVCP